MTANRDSEFADDASFEGANLGGRHFGGSSLISVCFDGADLREAKFERVSIDGASFRGAVLHGATFEHARARDVDFRGADLSGAFWEHGELTGADFASAELGGLCLRYCNCDGASFRDAALRGASLINSSFSGADFTGAILLHGKTLRSSFRDADLRGARAFSRCREIVVELLSRRAGQDYELLAAVGAAALRRDWCYDRWASLLEEMPKCRRLALETFAEYALSGFLDELKTAAEEGGFVQLLSELSVAMNSR